MPEERIFLLKPKAVMDDIPAESTDVESDNVIQRYSKRPRQLSRFCLADFVSKIDIIHAKVNKIPEKHSEEMMTKVVTVALVMKMKTFLMMAIVKVQTCCTKLKRNKIHEKKSTTSNKVYEV